MAHKKTPPKKLNNFIKIKHKKEYERNKRKSKPKQKKKKKSIKNLSVHGIGDYKFSHKNQLPNKTSKLKQLTKNIRYNKK